MGRRPTVFATLRQTNSWMSEETYAALERIKAARGVPKWKLLEVMGRLLMVADAAEAQGGRLAILDAAGKPEVILTLPQLLEGTVETRVHSEA